MSGTGGVPNLCTGTAIISSPSSDLAKLNSSEHPGNSNNGHVCHSPQHASSPVYVSNSGASSTGDRCSVIRLAEEVDVHVSTVPLAQQSHSETKDHPGG